LNATPVLTGHHVNPVAVYFLPEQDVTVEVAYGAPGRRILHMDAVFFQ
jgi:hypothetical protein